MKQLVARAILTVVFGGTMLILAAAMGDMTQKAMGLPSNLFTAVLLGAAGLALTVAVIGVMYWAMVNAEGE